MSSLKKLLFPLFLLGLVFTPLSAALAGYGLDDTAKAAGLGAGSPYAQDVPTMIGNVIGTALSMIAVIFFVLMVYGGFLWMTAHGDSGQIDKAKDTIIAAIIGIIVVLAAYAITNFVFDAVNGTKAAPTTPGGGGGTGGAPAAIGCCRYTDTDGLKHAEFNIQEAGCTNVCMVENTNCAWTAAGQGAQQVDCRI
jgi:hypothetical protein